jgi:hypothetical protein
VLDDQDPAPAPIPPAAGGSCETRPMRRMRTAVLIGPLIVGASVAGGLACGHLGRADDPHEPVLPAVDFRPRLVLDLDEGGVGARRGERDDPAVGTDPPRVPSGSVIEVHNAGSRDLRLQGGTAAFDTGTLRPGERTTVVLTNPGTEPLVLALWELTTASGRGDLTVAPAPGGS